MIDKAMGIWDSGAYQHYCVDGVWFAVTDDTPDEIRAEVAALAFEHPEKVRTDRYCSPEERRAAILAELAEIDRKRIRPLAEGEDARVAALNAEAVALRAELAAL